MSERRFSLDVNSCVCAHDTTTTHKERHDCAPLQDTNPLRNTHSCFQHPTAHRDRSQKPQSWVRTPSREHPVVEKNDDKNQRWWKWATTAHSACAPGALDSEADVYFAAPKKKVEKMALGDFLADQCTHSPPTVCDMER